MRTIRPQTPTRPTKSETLTETTITVHRENDRIFPGTAWEYTVRWRVVSAKSGKIAGIASFKVDGTVEAKSAVCSGPIFDPEDRSRLAVKLARSMDGSHPGDFAYNINKALAVAATTLLENATA